MPKLLHSLLPKSLHFWLPFTRVALSISFRVYLNPEDNAIDLRKGVAHYIDYYNTRRYHQGIDHQIPAARYAAAIAA